MKEEFKGIYLLSSIISLLLFAYILNFLIKLESSGCECARDWRRTYILSYMAFMVIHTCLAAYVTLMMPSPWLIKLYASLAPATLFFGILFVVFTFQYVHRLEKEKCGCSRTLGRAIMTLVAAIDAAVFAVIGLLILASIISMMLGFGAPLRKK